MMRIPSLALVALLFSTPLLANAAAPTVYQTTGKVQQWLSDRVVLAHDAVPALKWPAMTMPYLLPPDSHWTPLAAGTAVSFHFVQNANGYQLTDITPQSR